MSPALLWMEHVMGMERFWSVQFHTHDVAPEREHGSGLRSVVMMEPQSRLKFACNELLLELDLALDALAELRA